MVNEKFLELPEEKRLKIINAGLRVFSENEYKRASTEEIAELAGISKGLLFYYFHNKKELFLYLFDYVCELISSAVMDEEYLGISDFFELFRYAAAKKYELVSRHPQLFGFAVRAFLSRGEVYSEELAARMAEMTDSLSMERYFRKADYSKFREEADPQETVRMLTWLMEGYLQERQRYGLPLDFDDIMQKYDRWTDMLRRISYREEYL